MTENERKKAIKDALKCLRDGIQNLQDECGETITPHLRELGFVFEGSDDFALYDFIEEAADINAESFFSSVSYDIFSLCEDIMFNES